MRVSVQKEVLEAVLTYLGKRPYIETASLIHAVQQDARVVEEEKDEEAE